MLLNSSAVAKMHMGEYQDAESSLIEVRKRSLVCLWMVSVAGGGGGGG